MPLHILTWMLNRHRNNKLSQIEVMFQAPHPYQPWPCSCHRLLVPVNGISILPVSSLGFILYFSVFLAPPSSIHPPAHSVGSTFKIYQKFALVSVQMLCAWRGERTSPYKIALIPTLSIPLSLSVFHSTCHHIYLGGIPCNTVWGQGCVCFVHCWSLSV